MQNGRRPFWCRVGGFYFVENRSVQNGQTESDAVETYR